MKRIAAILTALTLLFCAHAFALTGTGYPAWDGVSVPENGFCGDIAGSKLMLEFDADAEYSNVANGFIQACYFAFDAAEQNYLELYLMIPEGCAPGDIYSPSTGAMSSISLYEVSKASEVLYFAGQAAGFAYPDGSSYELRITAVQRGADSISVSGTLDGTLCRFSGNMPTDEMLAMKGVSFSFTMPLSGALPAPETSAAPQNTPLPESSAEPFQTRPPQALPSAAPKATMDPHPAFTLPPNYAVI